MTTPDPTCFTRFQQRYRDGDLPWDHDLPPPEIIAVAERLPPGRVLDLGCGTARASVFLSVEYGITVVGDRQTDSAWYTLRRRG